MMKFLKVLHYFFFYQKKKNKKKCFKILQKILAEIKLFKKILKPKKKKKTKMNFQAQMKYLAVFGSLINNKESKK